MTRPLPLLCRAHVRFAACVNRLFLFLLLAGASVLPVKAIAQETRVSIGFLAPRSGSNQARGASMINGAQLAIDELNKKAIRVNNAKVVFELVPQDDRFDANAGKLATDYLLKRNPVALICHSSTVCIATAEQVRAARIPHISVGATNHKFTQLGYDNTFRMFGHSEQGGILFGHYVYGDLRVDRMAVIDDKTPSGMAMADQFASIGQLLARLDGGGAGPARPGPARPPGSGVAPKLPVQSPAQAPAQKKNSDEVIAAPEPSAQVAPVAPEVPPAAPAATRRRRRSPRRCAAD